MLFDILTFLLLGIVVAFLVMRVVFTIVMLRQVTPEIKGPDNNISTAKLEIMIKKALAFFDITDWHVVQSQSEEYFSIANAINHKTKTINITKFNFPSVGYEIDNLLGNIFYAAGVLKKEKSFGRFIILVNVVVPVFRALFYFFTFLQLTLYVIFKVDNLTIYQNIFLFKIMDWNMLFYIALAAAILSLIFSTFVYGAKESMEVKYEFAIAPFISQYCTEYSQDIVAARTFALAWKTNIMPVFARKASALKYFGPFVIYK
jgi:hypothetical protein